MKLLIGLLVGLLLKDFCGTAAETADLMRVPQTSPAVQYCLTPSSRYIGSAAGAAAKIAAVTSLRLLLTLLSDQAAATVLRQLLRLLYDYI